MKAKTPAQPAAKVHVPAPVTDPQAEKTQRRIKKLKQRIADFQAEISALEGKQ